MKNDDDYSADDFDWLLSDMAKVFGWVVLVCLAVIIILALSSCAYQQPGPTYGRTPADHMLEVGKTLIRADQGTL